jgi:DNA invertase Pin-like site-specific DNA recombinase
MKLAAYIRTATNEPSDQAHQITDWAETYSHVITNTYADIGVSGLTPPMDRPAFRQLLEDFEAGLIEGFACIRQDRISRDPAQFYQFEEWAAKLNLKIIYISEWEGTLISSILHLSRKSKDY